MPGVANLGLGFPNSFMDPRMANPTIDYSRSIQPVDTTNIELVEEDEDLKSKIMGSLKKGFQNPEFQKQLMAYGLNMMGPQYAQQNSGLLSSFGA